MTTHVVYGASESLDKSTTLRDVIADYRSKEYGIVTNPTPAQLPEEIKLFAPAISFLALGRERNAIVLVRAPGKWSERDVALRRIVEGLPAWDVDPIQLVNVHETRSAS